MKKNTFIITLLVVIIIATACNSKQEKPETQTESQKIDMHNAENSIEWTGIYEGTLPAASSEGIKMTVELKEDKTFNKTDVYIQNKPETFKENGTFEWDKDSSIIILNAKDQTYFFKVVENAIIMLDADKKENNSELASMYILKKK